MYLWQIIDKAHCFADVIDIFTIFDITYLCNIVKNWFKITFNKVFFCALLLLLAVNFISAISEDELLLQTTQALFVPVFLIFFFVKHKTLSIPFILFLIFTFLGDISSMVFLDEGVVKVTSVLYFLSFMHLVIMALQKFKISELDKLIGIYLLVVFLISLFFMHALYEIVQSIILDDSEVILFGAINTVLIILAFAAFAVFLNRQNKQSVLFITAVVCFVFSSALGYVNHYYLYDWSFVMLNKTLYIIGLYFMFKYIILEKKSRKTILIEEPERFSSDNILV